MPTNISRSLKICPISRIRALPIRLINNKIIPSGTTPSFHKRQLPDSLVALSSPNGKILFKEALLSGNFSIQIFNLGVIELIK